MSRGLGHIERAVLAIIEDQDGYDAVMGFDGTASAENLAERIYSKPKRIQSKARTKGWRKPPNTVIVTRPGKWGNHPAKELGIPKDDRVAAVAAYRDWLKYKATQSNKHAPNYAARTWHAPARSMINRATPISSSN